MNLIPQRLAAIAFGLALAFAASAGAFQPGNAPISVPGLPPPTSGMNPNNSCNTRTGSCTGEEVGTCTNGSYACGAVIGASEKCVLTASWGKCDGSGDLGACFWYDPFYCAKYSVYSGVGCTGAVLCSRFYGEPMGC